MNAKQRDFWYARVVRREEILNLPKPWNNYGSFCRACGTRVHKDKDNGVGLPQGNIDCIDNSGDHTDLRNLQLLCHSCNTKKNARDPTGTGNEDKLAFLQRTASEKKNADCEHRVRGWFISKAAHHPSVDTAIACAAELYGLSTVTTARVPAETNVPGRPAGHPGRMYSVPARIRLGRRPGRRRCRLVPVWSKPPARESGTPLLL